jgi:protein-tyrosine phosphatase
MAEALLRRRLLEVGEAPRVHSAGLRADGLEASGGAVEVLAQRGLDVREHRSRRMTKAMLEEADLVVCMAREHLKEAVVLHPPAWHRTFTLKELVRRAAEVGPRAPGQPFDEWLEKVHAGRTRAELLGAPTADVDVADPIGLPTEMYERTAVEIAALVDRLVDLGWREAKR